MISDEEATAKGGRYWWCSKGSDQPSIHRLPKDFKLDLCSVKIAFGLYFQGKEDPNDPQMRYPPYRTLKHYDIPSSQCCKVLSGWRNCFDVDAAEVLRDSDAWQRAVQDLKSGKAAELADVEVMWEACAPVFASMLGEHRRPEEAKMSTLITRRYQAYAEMAQK